MQALIFRKYGDLDGIEIDDVPEPHADAGQIRIAVKAASINPIDWKIVSGAMSGGETIDGYKQLGYDASGVVDEIGEGVAGINVGDDVFGLGSNTQSEFAVLKSWAAKPPSIDWSVAAAAGVSVETAERALRLLDVKPDSVLFIDGGAGGVGSIAVQVAIARGATVIASASDANHDYLREIHATPVLYGDGMVERIRTVGPDHIDAVFDVAGKTPIEDLISLVSDPSQVLSIANFNAAQAGARVTSGGADSQPFDALREGAELLEQNKLVIKVQTFPLDRAVEAYRISQGGHVRGKLILLP